MVMQDTYSSPAGVAVIGSMFLPHFVRAGCWTGTLSGRHKLPAHTAITLMMVRAEPRGRCQSGAKAMRRPKKFHAISPAEVLLSTRC
jgi:hypothetical protein